MTNVKTKSWSIPFGEPTGISLQHTEALLTIYSLILFYFFFREKEQELKKKKKANSEFLWIMQDETMVTLNPSQISFMSETWQKQVASRQQKIHHSTFEIQFKSDLLVLAIMTENIWDQLKVSQIIKVRWNDVVLYQTSWKKNTDTYSSATFWRNNFTTCISGYSTSNMNDAKNHSSGLFKKLLMTVLESTANTREMEH